jgi:hypothetical protein
MLVVREQTRHRSRVTTKTRHVLVCQYMRETFGAEAGFPGYRTFCRVWGEWFGPGGARPRNDGSDGLPVKAGHVVVSRPGQVVALDTTVLPVKVREGMFGDPVSVHGMALPRDPRRGRRRVRRIRARRAAVLHPGDRHHRSRVGLQKPPAPGSAESPGLQRSPRPHAAPSGQGRLRAGVRGVQAAAVREAARLRRRRRRRPRCRPGT